MPPALTHDEFSQHVNTRFQVQIDDGTTIEMELAEISELKVHPNQEEFAVVFRGPSNAFLQQGIRSVTHEQMGQFELFLVPIQQDTQGFYYEAVFNRVRE
jgi:hypothetical protein